MCFEQDKPCVYESETQPGTIVTEWPKGTVDAHDLQAQSTTPQGQGATPGWPSDSLDADDRVVERIDQKPIVRRVFAKIGGRYHQWAHVKGPRQRWLRRVEIAAKNQRRHRRAVKAAVDCVFRRKWIAG